MCLLTAWRLDCSRPQLHIIMERKFLKCFNHKRHYAYYVKKEPNFGEKPAPSNPGPLKGPWGQISSSQGHRLLLRKLPMCSLTCFFIVSFWLTLRRRFSKDSNFLISFLFVLSTDTFGDWNMMQCSAAHTIKVNIKRFCRESRAYKAPF